MKRIVAGLLVLLLVLAGCAQEAPVSTTEQTGQYRIDPQRNEVIIDDAGEVTAPTQGNARVYYQIFVGSFSDSNGDGIGDLRGIINRFDYLNDGDDNSGVSLGVEGLWLSPIFNSPSYHKYDVTDYYTIDPDFGTEEDLKELIDLCHSRNVQIILDLPINHSSRMHKWFQEFVSAHQEGETDNPYYDFYSWAEEKPAGRTFSAINRTSHFYECNFSGDMPELNFDNEAVRQQVVELSKYWLDLGVDGYRFDAAKYIYYGEESRNLQFWDWYMAELRAIKPDIYTVAEVWDSDGLVIPYCQYTDCFNFTMAQSEGKIAAAAKGGNVSQLTDYVEQYIGQIRSNNPNAMLKTFISNHDMDRVAGYLTLESGRAYMAANLSMLMPGSPFIYYGEEVCLRGSRGGSNTDANRRLVMPWGDGDTVKNPTGANYENADSYGTVAEQLPNKDSLYNHYKKLIAIRKANPEIAEGSYTSLHLKGTKAGGFLSTLDGSTVAVLHNTTTEPVEIDLTQIDADLTKLAAVVGRGEATLEGTVLTLGGQTSVVLR